MRNDQTSERTASWSAALATVVRLRERVVDAFAALCLVSGTGLFLFARYSLTSLANGTYVVPAGVPYISRADLHVAQSQIGLILVAVGLAVAIGSAMIFSHGRRVSARRILASTNAS